MQINHHHTFIRSRPARADIVWVDHITYYFRPKKKTISRLSAAKVGRQIFGVLLHLIDDGLSILQCVHDTILLVDNYSEKAKNLKQLLCDFEELHGLKVNFYK
jgi:hypothetical protein